MIIANIQTSKTEDHSIHTKEYGAGAVFAKYARIHLNNGVNEFWDIAPWPCHSRVLEEERRDRCITLSETQMGLVKIFAPIKEILGEDFCKKVDIFIFNNDNIVLNLDGLKAIQVLWMAFVNQTCTPLIPHCFIYSDDQNPRFDPRNTQIHKIKIGKPVEDIFSPIQKEDFFFQCTRNDTVMDTIHTVKLCNEHRVKGYFAGPILNNYPLLEHINNKHTFYLGTLSEKHKLWYSKNARLYGCIQNWDTIFSLSAIEAFGQGTPVIARNRGCFRYLIEDGVNGFYYNDPTSFWLAWQNSTKIKQLDCYNKGLEYSEKEMVNSFYREFERILR